MMNWKMTWDFANFQRITFNTFIILYEPPNYVEYLQQGERSASEGSHLAGATRGEDKCVISSGQNEPLHRASLTAPCN